jgi:hypothetical protein
MLLNCCGLYCAEFVTKNIQECLTKKIRRIHEIRYRLIQNDVHQIFSVPTKLFANPA